MRLEICLFLFYSYLSHIKIKSALLSMMALHAHSGGEVRRTIEMSLLQKGIIEI